MFIQLDRWKVDIIMELLTLPELVEKASDYGTDCTSELLDEIREEILLQMD